MVVRPESGGIVRVMASTDSDAEGRTVEQRWLDAFGEVLSRSHLFQADELAETVDTAMSRVGIRTTIYLVDDEQRTLLPMPQSNRADPQPAPVDSSVPGRVFALVQTAPTRDTGGWWVPMVDGTDRLGVIEFAVSGGVDVHDAVLRERCRTMAGLVGHLVTVTAPKGDHIHRVRRSQPMSTAGELLWQMLPPLTAGCDRVVISAVLEPCYDVGGDGFDYAVDGDTARVVVLDAVGHGLAAGLACTVALAAIRASRRAGHGLYDQARAADGALLDQFAGGTFATAVLAELDLGTGVLRYINAGHPAPLLLRAGRLVHELAGGGRMPLGLDDATVGVAEEVLEPGDRLLVYTDGITEARDPAGVLFGLPRLVDHVQRHAGAGLPGPETLRRLAHAVSAHHEGPATDDATLLLAEWTPVAAARAVP